MRGLDGSLIAGVPKPHLITQRAKLSLLESMRESRKSPELFMKPARS